MQSNSIAVIKKLLNTIETEKTPCSGSQDKNFEELEDLNHLTN